MYLMAKGYHHNNVGLIGGYFQETNCEIIIIIIIIIIINMQGNRCKFGQKTVV